MTSRRRRAAPTRAAWWAPEIPPQLDAATRRRLVEANRGFEVGESLLAELERDLVVLFAEPQRLDISRKAHRAELAALEQMARQLREALASLHPRSRQALRYWHPGFTRELREALGVLHRACAEALKGIPGAGRPNVARRDAVIRAVCRLVDSLQPNRFRRVSLIASSDSLMDRRLKSVKVVCGALKLRLDGDAARIIRKALGKEST